ncbi:oleate hydratase [Leucothrix arctica]|uniref:Oleate hydratase n=1 Tax=Leucothrix arctica TaxID=1481894 RepID=A0A317C8R6_9GAMM|nr:oleate hydratase [Leucothrix arctica]PWQ93783.1 oleate hydratase [Leucothrix arctica]
MNTNNKDIQAYLVGGGIGSMAAAAFMIRDGGVPGENITIYEALPVVGGVLDAAGTPEDGYSMRGGRMLCADIYECMWSLLKTIPSLTDPTKSVFDETVEFNKIVKTDAHARIINKNRAVPDLSSLGLSMHNRLELLRLLETSEEKLGNDRITDWLSPELLETNFWYMWITSFAFEPWHSAVEFKRYMHRFLFQFTEISTMSGISRTVYNEYDSIVRPLEAWLSEKGVTFLNEHTVTDLNLIQDDDGKWTVNKLEYTAEGKTDTVLVGKNDLVFFQNASMGDASSLGSMTNPPQHLTKEDSKGWVLWEKLAEGRPEFGNPAVFNSSIPESNWESFVVTLEDPEFFKQMEELTGNKHGTGALVTFKDSNWLLSIVLKHQLRYPDQPEGIQVFWGYSLRPDRIGDFVNKSMTDCNGKEILQEVCGHLRFDKDKVFTTANCIPCRMPYITSMFMPRSNTDRPLPVPKTSRNLAFVSQFVEIENDCVFTVEYSVRAAQMAVYELLGIDKEIPPITRHDKSLKVNLEAALRTLK